MLYSTHCVIHLKNIIHNIKSIKETVNNNSKIMIAVKADAYGHGAIEISKLAQDSGLVDYLAIATVQEGVELRKAGITLPILKLSPAFEEEMEAAIANNITICVCEKANILKYNQIAINNNKKAKIHLQLDTGMGRVGITNLEEAINIANIVKNKCQGLELEGIMTHLPVSDDNTNRTFTERQIDKFNFITNAIEKELSFKFKLRHCANSAAIITYPNAYFDMVRSGIIVYGYYPSENIPHTLDLKPGLSFKSKLSFIKKVKKGTSIGYGRTWIAPDDTWIATFPTGYADGFNRLFSNSGKVLINGLFCPIIGRVCMDQTMCSLGNTEKCNAKVGDEVILIGESGKEKISADDWAKSLNTISYEILCKISKRVKRYYD